MGIAAEMSILAISQQAIVNNQQNQINKTNCKINKNLN